MVSVRPVPDPLAAGYRLALTPEETPYPLCIEYRDLLQGCQYSSQPHRHRLQGRPEVPKTAFSGVLDWVTTPTHTGSLHVVDSDFLPLSPVTATARLLEHSSHEPLARARRRFHGRSSRSRTRARRYALRVYPCVERKDDVSPAAERWCDQVATHPHGARIPVPADPGPRYTLIDSKNSGRPVRVLRRCGRTRRHARWRWISSPEIHTRHPISSAAWSRSGC